MGTGLGLGEADGFMGGMMVFGRPTGLGRQRVLGRPMGFGRQTGYVGVVVAVVVAVLLSYCLVRCFVRDFTRANRELTKLASLPLPL